MDLGTILGIVIALVAIVGGNALEGGHLHSLMQGTAFLIVGGGTVGATMVGFPLKVFIKGVKAAKLFFTEKKSDPAKLVEEIAEYAVKARREGIIALEAVAPNASSPFLQKALMMAVDGIDSKTMRENLEMVVGHMEEEGEKPAKIWEAAGGYAPTIGIIGAVMGLIHVMQNLSDVAKVGEGIAVAFVATIYGVGLANIIFLPAANKLKAKHHDDMVIHLIMLEGALAIQEGQNPNLIKQKLEGLYAEHGHDEKGGAPAKAAA